MPKHHLPDLGLVLRPHWMQHSLFFSISLFSLLVRVALKLRSLRFPISRLCRIAVFFDTNHHTAFPTFFHAFVLLHGLSIQIHVLLHFLSLASPSYACPFLRAAGTRITSLGVLEPCSNPLVSGRSLMSRRGIECGSACAFCAHDGGECT